MWTGGALEAVKLTRIEPEGRASFRKLAEKTGVWACFTCRTCTASCPVSAVNPDFNPLRIIRMALYGLEKEILEYMENS